MKQSADLGDLIITQWFAEAGKGRLDLAGVAEADQDGSIGCVLQGIPQAHPGQRRRALAEPFTDRRQPGIQGADAFRGELRVRHAVVAGSVSLVATSQQQALAKDLL